MIKSFKIALASIGVLCGLELFNSHLRTVKASSNQSHYVSTYPKSMQGTWYGYQSYPYDKSLNKIVIKGNRMTVQDPKYKTNYTSFLHMYKSHVASNLSKEQQKNEANWEYAKKSTQKFRGYYWLWVHSWTSDTSSGDFYSVANLKGHKVLTWASSANVLVIGHFYQSKKLAKENKTTHYPNFKYGE